MDRDEHREVSLAQFRDYVKSIYLEKRGDYNAYMMRNHKQLQKRNPSNWNMLHGSVFTR